MPAVHSDVINTYLQPSAIMPKEVKDITFYYWVQTLNVNLTLALKTARKILFTYFLKNGENM